MKRSDVVKMIWEHVKANDLQVPTDKRVRASCPRKSKLLFVFVRVWGAHVLVPRCFVVVIDGAVSAAANESLAAAAAAAAAVVLVLVVAVDLLPS